MIEGVLHHRPPGYACPFCQLITGGSTSVNDANDIVARTDEAVAFISPRWWPNNHGHALVVPIQHHENLYELPARAGHAVHDLVQTIAIAMRETYGCDRVSTRQHNEPAGGHDVWHFHMHVFPRYDGDNLYGSRPYPDFVASAERQPFAQKLREHIGRKDQTRRVIPHRAWWRTPHDLPCSGCPVVASSDGLARRWQRRGLQSADRVPAQRRVPASWLFA